jgi:hypothetical protein
MPHRARHSAILGGNPRSTLRFAATIATRLACAATLLVALPAWAGPPNEQPDAKHTPTWSEDYAVERTVRVGEPLDLRISVTAPDRAPISFDAREVPPGMKLAASQEGATATVTLKWMPRGADVGVHELTLNATDGATTLTKDVKIVVVDEWESWLLPGLQYSMFAPYSSSDYGTFHGISAEILIASWIHRNENRGPSHGRVFVDLDVLQSTHSGLGAAFNPSMGFDLSVERNPLRRYLLPHFGLKFGAFLQRDMPHGGFAELTPQLGLYLYADKNVFVNAAIGYQLPLRADDFDALRGVRGLVGIDFSMW